MWPQLPLVEKYSQALVIRLSSSYVAIIVEMILLLAPCLVNVAILRAMDLPQANSVSLMYFTHIIQSLLLIISQHSKEKSNVVQKDYESKIRVDPLYALCFCPMLVLAIFITDTTNDSLWWRMVIASLWIAQIQEAIRAIAQGITSSYWGYWESFSLLSLGLLCNNITLPVSELGIIFLLVLWASTFFLYGLSDCFKYGEGALLSQLACLFLYFLYQSLGKLEFGDSDHILYLSAGLIFGVIGTGILLLPLLKHLSETGAEEKKKQYLSYLFYLLFTALIAAIIYPGLKWQFEEHPFIWVIHFLLKDGQRFFICIYWICLMVLAVFGSLYFVASNESSYLNLKRKYYHLLATLMFTPAYWQDRMFLQLSFSVALTGFLFLELLRSYSVYPFGEVLQHYLRLFTDERDGGRFILSHIYLLLGCALPVWLNRSSSMLPGLCGIIFLGVGDAVASVVGYKFGQRKWPGSSRTIEGTLSFWALTVPFMCLLEYNKLTLTSITYIMVGCLTTGLLEAVSSQNDNIILPLYSFCILSKM